MSLKELEGKAEDRLDLENLPKSIDAMLISYAWTADKSGKMVYIANFADRTGKKFTQKYSPYHLEKFVEACKEMGVDGFKQLEGSWVTYGQVTFGMGFPRYVPVAIATT